MTRSTVRPTTTLVPTTSVAGSRSVSPLLLTMAQACEELHLSENSLRGLMRRREIRAMKLGRAVRIPRTELERFIAERMEAGS